MGGLRWCPEDHAGRSGAMACGQQLGVHPYVEAVGIRCAQNTVAKAIKEFEDTDDVFGEVFDGLAAHLKAKGVDEDGVRAQVGRLRSFAPSCIRMVPPEVKEVDVQEEAFEVEQARQHMAKGPCVVSMSMRTSVRCLHLVGGCWRQPGVGYLKYEDLGPIADASKYNRVCKQCWPSGFEGTAAQVEEKAVNESEEESSSSSSSSGSSALVAASPARSELQPSLEVCGQEVPSCRQTKVWRDNP